MSDELEAQLRAGGAKVAEGVFKVDARRALAKLREYRLAEPHHWVLEVLRAASSVNARTVEVETDTDDVILRFDGKEFPAAVMKDLLARALDSTGEGDRRSARSLSLGIAGALGLAPKWIKVRSGSVALEIRPPDEVTVSAVPSKEEGTLVHVRKRFGWNVIKAALADVTPEEVAIVDRARRYGPTLTLNEKPLGKDELFKGGLVVSSTWEGEGMELVVGVPASGAGGMVVFDVDGVVVARRALELPGRWLVAWARCDRMRRNASGSDVVDSDPAVVSALERIRLMGLDVTRKMGALIAEKKVKEVWRTRYCDYALKCWADPTLDPEVRPILAGFPLIPGLHGEWFSPDDFAREATDGRPIYYALETFPRGSYPRPMALLGSANDDPIARLLPAKQRTNAAKTVRAKARAAQHKDRWLASPIEAAALGGGGGLDRSAIDEPKLKGEVALSSASSGGAFVRLLCQGRFVQQGDVASLEPLRLRAVVDWQKDVPEKLWPEIPSDKLWSLVLDTIEAEVSKMVIGLLGKTPGPQICAHALDLLIRRANKGGRAGGLPKALREAKLFPLTDGSKVSLADLDGHPSVHFVREPTRARLLSGEPVLVLSPELEQALGKLATRGLVNARERLELERGIRDRLDGPRQPAKLTGMRAVIELSAEGLTGQVGVPLAAGSELELTLLREGIELEKTSLTAGYGLARAIVDCAGFTPNDRWDTVVRDQTFDRALAVVRAAERQLAGAVLASSPGTLDELPAGHAQFLVVFMRKHLRRTPDPEGAEVDHAPLFRTSAGPLSLAALRPQAGPEQRLWSLPHDSAAAVPEGMQVVLVRPEHSALLSDLLGVRVEDATAELERRRTRDRFLGRPVTPIVAPEGAALCGALTAPRVSGLIGLAKEDSRDATIDVLVHGRFFSRELFLARLPLCGTLAVEGVDPAEPGIPPEARDWLVGAIRAAEHELLDRALADLAAPGARRAVCLALQRQLDRNLTGRRVGGALAELPLFPCTDGQLRSARALDGSKKVLFVTEPIDGAPISRDPVVVAVDPELRAVLARWPITEDVTSALRRELDARSSRLAIKPLETIALPEGVRWRRQLNEGELEGEVGIVPAGGGRLQLLYERRPISTIEGALPEPLTAIVNNDALTLAPFDQGVVPDAPYKAMLERLRVEAELLLEQVADALFAASEEDRRQAGPLLGPLTFWLVARKKRSARLVKLPLFETTAGAPLSLAQIFEEQRSNKSVQWSDEAGAPLSQSRCVWRPRRGELELLRKFPVNLKDATASLRNAAAVRSRRKVVELTVTAEGPRETLSSDRLQGEVGLRSSPTRVLLIELYREHTLLETFAPEHPVGAVARINCDKLTPNANWTKAVRNKQFKQAIAEIEGAVERLVARRLESAEGDWRPFAEAAIRWNRAPGGPLAQVLPRLSVFTGLDGTPITVGAALAEHSRSGRVLIAEPGLPPPKDRLVLASSPTATELLRVLGLQTEDTSPLLKRSIEIEAGLQARRLSSLQYAGDAIVRLPIASEGLRGELVIVGPDEVAQVVLAKDGIRVCSHPIGKLPIAGVVNVDGLEVNEEWTSAVLPRPLKARLEEAAEELFTALAARSGGFSADDKARARTAALAYLADLGFTSASHLERMKGAAAALAGAPLFLSEEGQWVPLRAIADQVLRTGWISIFEKAWRTRDTGEELVLRAAGLREPWISGLEQLLGASCVERVHDVELWRTRLAERDPAAGTPGSDGLKRLRMQMRLLRAGALGHVTPDELEDVRVRSGGARAPISYDRKRKLVFLDADDPQIARALEEIPRRPERLYVLLAAIYGAVNRTLERITDADEAQLLTALAAHLAANPKCLGSAGEG